MWNSRVRKLYGTFQTLQSYDSAYGIAQRLGFPTCSSLWKDNPVIQGSVHPSDLKVLRK